MLCEDVSDPDFWTLARKFEVSKGEMKMPCWVPRVALQHIAMAKKLHDSNTPPDICHLFNENRTFYFESDISAIPNPPCTLPAPTTATAPRLHKSMSQPVLSVTRTVTSLNEPRVHATPLHTAANLHLPTAIMASTSIQDAFHTDVRGDSSVESRYQTNPSYASSTILKSFRHELRLFGHGAGSQTVQQSDSSPASPHRGSVPCTGMEVMEESRPRSNSDPRRLSLPQVKEEAEQGMRSDGTTLALAPLSSQEVEPKKLQRENSQLFSSPAVDAADGAMAKGSNLPLTRQVLDWFTSPQAQSKVSKTELNAMCPTSF